MANLLCYIFSQAFFHTESYGNFSSAWKGYQFIYVHVVNILEIVDKYTTYTKKLKI